MAKALREEWEKEYKASQGERRPGFGSANPFNKTGARHNIEFTECLPIPAPTDEIAPVLANVKQYSEWWPQGFIRNIECENETLEGCSAEFCISNVCWPATLREASKQRWKWSFSGPVEGEATLSVQKGGNVTKKRVSVDGFSSQSEVWGGSGKNQSTVCYSLELEQKEGNASLGFSDVQQLSSVLKRLAKKVESSGSRERVRVDVDNDDDDDKDEDDPLEHIRKERGRAALRAKTFSA